jgi:molybdenum cofactor cytidylyltransferase
MTTPRATGIAGVVLAAGLSRRMGQPKLLLDLGGAPILRRSVQQILSAGLDEVVVVTGPDAAPLAAALAGLAVRRAQNPDPAAGQAGSVVAGVAALGPDVEAAVLALGDQPTVSPDVIRALVAAWRATGRPIAAPVYRDGRGNPVLFARDVFPELLALTGDTGARTVIAADAARVTLVPVDAPMPPDVDTPEDLARLRGEAPGAPHRPV